MRRLFLLALLAPAACVDDPDPLLADREDFTCSRELQGTVYVGLPGPRQLLAGHCIDPQIDLDLATEGVQPDCVVTLYRDVDWGGERELDVLQQLPACDSVPASEPCLAAFAANADECLDGKKYEIRLGDFRSAFPLWAEFRCRLACEP